MFHLVEGRLNSSEIVLVGRTARGDPYLCSPCPVTRHPFTIDPVLAVRVVIDSLGSKIPFPFKGWVPKKGLNALEGIVVK
jgi:hypothetical protein